MLRKAQQGSAGGSRDGWPLVAALLACLPIILVSAADAVAAVPSAAAIPSAAAAIPSATQRAAAVVPAPIRETAGHAAAALPAAGRPAAPSAGATSIAGHSAQIAAGDPTEAVKTATHVPSGVAAGAGGLPAVAKAVPAVEHTATRIGQLTKDLAAAAESSGKEPRALLASAAKAAGGFGPAASRRAHAVESPVPRATSASKSAASPAAGGIKGPPSHHSAWAGGGGLRPGTVAGAPLPARPGAASLAAPRAELAAATAGRRPTLVQSPSATAPARRPERSMNGPIDPRVLTAVSRFGPLLTPAAPLTAGAARRRGALGAVARLPGPAGTGPMPVPSGGPGSAAGGFGVAFSIFLALAGFLLIALVGAMRPLRLCAEPWRAAPHLLIPERPG